MRRAALLVFVSAALFGCSDRVPKTRGAAVEGMAVPISSLQNVSTQTPVVLHGAMTAKCPVAGCWFMLRDESGIIKVDTRNAGFVVVDVPLNTSVTVAGVVITNGPNRSIDATGLRY